MVPRVLSVSPTESQQSSSSSNIFRLSTLQWMALSSLPMIGGAYVGYRMELSRMAISEAVVVSECETNIGQQLQQQRHVVEHGRIIPPSTSIIRPVNGPLLALKALGIGTMLSIGGVGLLTAAIFRAHGCSTLDELLNTWKEWAPRKRKELLEDSWGIHPKSMQHEDVIATRGFSEDEEWDYIKKKYIPELVDNKSNHGKS